MSVDLIQIAKEVLKEGKGRAELIRRVPGTTTWAARQALDAARRDDPVLASAKQVLNDPILRIAAIKLLRKGTTLAALADDLSISTAAAEALVDSIDAHGYPVAHNGDGLSISTPGAGVDQPVIPVKAEHHDGGGTFTFGFITDTHLCSRFQRLDVLNFAYDTFEKRGVRVVLHAGNLVDGESKVNQHDLLVHGIAEQANYVLENYPKRKGVVTYYIDGDDHEGWWQQREGIEFGRYLAFEAEAHGRRDLRYMGYMENDIPVKVAKGECVIRVVHPGGGSSYAHSYTSQKIVESYSPGEKPAILLIGHYHKANFSVVRGVHVVQGGCTQDQSTFMRKKRLEAHIGFWVITVTLDINGAVSAFMPEFYHFFDRGYYAKRDDIRFES